MSTAIKYCPNRTTSYTLATYMGPFSNDFYASQAATAAAGLGFSGASSGSFVTFTIDIPEAGFDCGDVIWVTIGGNTVFSNTVSCPDVITNTPIRICGDCQLIPAYDTLPSTTTHHSYTFTIYNLLQNFSENISITDNNGTFYNMVTYNPGYVSTSQYAADVAAYLDGLTGVNAHSSGSDIIVRFSVDTSDFNCGETVTLTQAFGITSSTVIDCPNTYKYNPYWTCEINDDYRYGFNNQEKDNELLGTGNSYTAEFWQYDPRLGRRFNIDPKIAPPFSPYSCFANNPICFIDPKGDTVTLSPAFKENHDAMVQYDVWKKSEAGKEFLKDYGEGGKYYGISVVFELAEILPNGNTGIEIVDKNDGSVEKINPSNTENKKVNIANIKDIVAGNDKEKFLRFTITLDKSTLPTDNKQRSVAKIRGATTLLHETQHIRISHQSLLSSQTIISRLNQHKMMRDVNSKWYKERYNQYKLNRDCWFQHYTENKHFYKSEDDFIQKEINDFYN